MTRDPSRKPRASGSYACGTETYERILNAAIELFGERGFEAASTREIARRAGILAPLLNYYFANKEGVYRACASMIAENTRNFFDSNMTAIDRLLEEQATAEQLQAQLEALLRCTLEFLLTNQLAQQRRLFLMQDQAGNGPGGQPDATLMQHRMQHIQVINKLVAALCGMDEADPLLRIRTLTLQGHVSIFYGFRLPMLNMLGWEQVDAERLELISNTVIDNTRTLISAWRNEGAVTEQP